MPDPVNIDIQINSGGSGAEAATKDLDQIKEKVDQVGKSGKGATEGIASYEQALKKSLKMLAAVKIAAAAIPVVEAGWRTGVALWTGDMRAARREALQLSEAFQTAVKNTPVLGEAYNSLRDTDTAAAIRRFFYGEDLGGKESDRQAAAEADARRTERAEQAAERRVANKKLERDLDKEILALKKEADQSATEKENQSEADRVRLLLKQQQDIEALTAQHASEHAIELKKQAQALELQKFDYDALNQRVDRYFDRASRAKEEFTEAVQLIHALSEVGALSAADALKSAGTEAAMYRDEVQQMVRRIRGELSEGLFKPEDEKRVRQRLFALEASVKEVQLEIINGWSEAASKSIAEDSERIQSLFEAGAISQQQAIVKNAESLGKMRDAMAEAQRQADTLLDQGFSQEEVDRVKERIQQVSYEAEKANAKAITGVRLLQEAQRDAAISLQTTTQHAVDDFFFRSIKHARDARSAFADMLDTLADGMLRVVTGRIAERFVGILSGGLVGGGLFAAGGAAAGFASGGLVPGSGSGDIVPARLEPGEVVIPRRVVSLYGASTFLNLIRSATTPTISASGHYAAGGVVGPAPVSGPVPAFVVANEREMEKLLAGGTNSTLRWLNDNRTAVRNTLGI